MIAAQKVNVGPVAIVAGAASEHGASVTRALAGTYRLLLVDGETVSELAESIRAGGGMAESLTIDLADPEAVAAIGDFALGRLGPPRVYIHCHRLASSAPQGWMEVSVELWDRTFAESVRSVWLGCRAVTPLLKANPPAKILVIGSDGAASGLAPVHQATAVSALIGVVRALAREVGDDNIAVNMVCPPHPGREPAVAPALGRSVVGSVSDAVSFLCSDDAEFITGQSWLLNGGSWLQ